MQYLTFIYFIYHYLKCVLPIWVTSHLTCFDRRSQWPRGLRSAAARLLGLWVRIPPGGMDVCLMWVLCVVR
jgi:hypothetical protein